MLVEKQVGQCFVLIRLTVIVGALMPETHLRDGNFWDRRIRLLFTKPLAQNYFGETSANEWRAR